MKQKHILFSAVSGNILEYYDFIVYTVFISAIGRSFFPESSQLSQTLAALAIFAVGFLTRPVGGILFGYIADRFGRRISLILSMLGMTIPTFCIGLTPSYETIGILAPALLVLFRLMQGLCISGEGAGTAIFVLEHKHNMRPGFVSSLVHASNIVGTILAAFIGLLICHYFPNSIYHWRFAFILGGLFGLASLYLRLKLSETPIFQQVLAKKMLLKSPFLHVVQTAWRPMIITFCCGALASSIVYLVKTYVRVFYQDLMLLSEKTSIFYLSYACFVLMIGMPLFGYLSDLFGRIRLILLSSSAIIICIIPALVLMAGQTLLEQIMGVTLLALLAASFSGVSYLFIISLFKPEERFSGVAFSYNFGIAIFGGTSASISRYLVEHTGKYYAPGFYIMFTAGLFLLAIFAMKDSLQQSQ